MRPFLIVLTAIGISACGSNAEVTTTMSVRSVATLQNETPEETGERRSAESCTIVSRTLETAIEAHFAQHQYDIAAAEELVSGGYLIDLDADFVVDFASDVPTPTPVPGGSCDFDFEAARSTEQAAWVDRQCWLDQIAVETAVRGYTAQLGYAPESFDDITSVLPAFHDSWPSVELGPDAEIIDLIPGGCSIAGNLDVFGDMWVAAPPQCAADAWTLAWALYLTDRFDEVGVSTQHIVEDGLIEQRPYLYEVVDGGVSNVEDSGCPLMDSVDESAAQREADACAVERRTLDTASEAFFAQFARHPASIDELVEVEFLRESPDGWSLTVSESGGAVIEPLPGSRCNLAD